MRFLLINLPIRQEKVPNAFPTGLGILAQVLLDSGHHVDVIDGNAHRYTIDQVVELCGPYHADVIGLGGLISTYSYQYELIPKLKKRYPGTLILAGGGCSTSVPELMMERTPVDFLALGEAEHTIVDLANALEQGAPLEEVAGLVVRTKDGWEHTATRPTEMNLDLFPFPAYDLFPTEIYVNNPFWAISRPSLNLITSRGCPMDCKFCYNIFGYRSYRRRGPQNIVDEVKMVAERYKLEFIGFVDDNLTVHKKHLKEVCWRMKETGLPWGCHGRVDCADDERLEVMTDSGCIWLGFGVESFSNVVLLEMSKRTTAEVAREAIIRTRNHGLFPNTTFIYGYPGETRETIAETLRTKLELQCMNQAFFATPYPGTDLYRLAAEQGWIKDQHDWVTRLDDATEFLVNFTDIPDAELVQIKQYQDWMPIYILGLLRFQFETANEDQLSRFLNSCDGMLNRDHLVPEIKGYVLHALARYYDWCNQRLQAYKCRKVAKQFLPGGLPDVPPFVDAEDLADQYLERRAVELAAVDSAPKDLSQANAQQIG